MAHNRKFVPGFVALVKGRLKNTGVSSGKLQDEMEQLIIETGFLKNAPFRWVGLLILYGIKNDSEIIYEKINKKYGDVPVEIEVDFRDLKDADNEGPEALYKIFKRITLFVLIDIAKKYNLPHEIFEKELDSLGGWLPEN